MTPDRLRQIEELYHSARQCEPGERAAFLTEACKGDLELCQQVESLLGSDPSSSGFLERPIQAEAAIILDSKKFSDRFHLAPGRELGPYVVESSLGAGG